MSDEKIGLEADGDWDESDDDDDPLCIGGSGGVSIVRELHVYATANVFFA